MSAPPAGWYADPSEPAQQRWWNGAVWTEQTYAAPAVGTLPPPPLPSVLGPRFRLPVWGWVVAGVIGILLLVFLAPLVAVIALTVMITGIVALVRNSPTWLRFRSRGWALSATLLAAVLLFVSSGISSAMSSGDGGTERAASSSESSRPALAEATAAPTPTPTSTPTPTPTPTPTFREVVATERIAFSSTTVEDGALAQGQTVVTTEGRDGERTLTYRVTELDGVEIERELISDVVTAEPVTHVTSIGTYVAPPPPPAPSCDPNYADACVPIASDVDCAWGTGDGPAYFDGVARVVGSDVYGLDRDGDGYACER